MLYYWLKSGCWRINANITCKHRYKSQACQFNKNVYCQSCPEYVSRFIHRPVIIAEGNSTSRSRPNLVVLSVSESSSTVFIAKYLKFMQSQLIDYDVLMILIYFVRNSINIFSVSANDNSTIKPYINFVQHSLVYCMREISCETDLLYSHI